MASILLISSDVIGPRMAGPGIRAWEIAHALGRHGFRVTLAAPGKTPGSGGAAAGDFAARGDEGPARDSATSGDEAAQPQIRTVRYGVRGDRLREVAAESDAILVQGLVLAHYPFLAGIDKPLVVDLYDPFVLENLQARSGQTLSGRERSQATDLAALNSQLVRGDYFVCASESQRDFWLGMLTALGRVNPANYDADPTLRRLVDVVPFGLPEEPPQRRRKVLRGVLPGFGEGERIVLWGGGIWNWFDPLTLLRAVSEVVRERDDLRLVFMGTQTPSPFVPDMAMLSRARNLAGELGLLGRVVHFNEGWVPYEERADYLLEADIGASCHLDHIETRFAFRTRLLDCIWAGLPMLVTEGDVLARTVAREGLGRTVPPRDVAATAGALRALLDEPGGRDAFASSFERVRAKLTWPEAVTPLARFLADPARAPDLPAADAGLAELTATPAHELPRRAAEIVREGGPLLLAEEMVRYVRWLRRGR